MKFILPSPLAPLPQAGEGKYGFSSPVYGRGCHVVTGEGNYYP